MYIDPCGTCKHFWFFFGVVDCLECRLKELEQTVQYDVPLYSQGGLSLCWAFCEVMVTCYKSGTTLSRKEAKATAIGIAQTLHGSTDKKVWNQGGWPSDLGDEVVASDLDLQALTFAAKAAEKQVSVNKQDWLPKLQAGFRRNTDSEMSMNGFVVGGSIPLFSNRKKVQIAKAQAVSAQLMQEDAQLQVENTLMSLFNEMQHSIF